MTKALIKRRKMMLDAFEMGTQPITFLSKMAEDAVIDIPDPEEQKKTYDREYRKLERDWHRRMGPRGWIHKLEEIEEISGVTSRQIYQVRQVQFFAMRMMRDVREIPPMIQTIAMGRLLSSINLENKIRGIRPPVQPDILTVDEIEELEVRLQSDQFYDLLYAADPELTQAFIKKIVRISDLPDIDLKDHT